MQIHQAGMVHCCPYKESDPEQYRAADGQNTVCSQGVAEGGWRRSSALRCKKKDGKKVKAVFYKYMWHLFMIRYAIAN